MPHITLHDLVELWSLWHEDGAWPAPSLLEGFAPTGIYTAYRDHQRYTASVPERWRDWAYRIPLPPTDSPPSTLLTYGLLTPVNQALALKWAPTCKNIHERHRLYYELLREQETE